MLVSVSREGHSGSRASEQPGWEAGVGGQSAGGPSNGHRHPLPVCSDYSDHLVLLAKSAG